MAAVGVWSSRRDEWRRGVAAVGARDSRRPSRDSALVGSKPRTPHRDQPAARPAARGTPVDVGAGDRVRPPERSRSPTTRGPTAPFRATSSPTPPEGASSTSRIPRTSGRSTTEMRWRGSGSGRTPARSSRSWRRSGASPEMRSASAGRSGNVPAGHHGFRRPVDQFVTSPGWGFALTLPLLVLGVWYSLRGGDGERRWLGIVGLVTGGHRGRGRSLLRLCAIRRHGVAVSVHGDGRGRGETASDRAVGRGNDRVRRLPWAIVGTLVLVEAWGATGSREFDARGTALSGAEHLNPHATIYLDVRSVSDTRSSPSSNSPPPPAPERR